ncbi:hypothetical protein HanXRQr2_Chr02g0049231 [Helianthus annuus]|uniref:Uncharacterized protein n=1 Tax=Helianthus annuus TaxID=4232 RepID=A0A9K3JLJ0_HELAN|nr:hypothetical protein HanXRQr2_Chr02g0049231 [Helianthus annuus]
MKVQMSLQQTQMDRFYLLISLLWMRSSIRNLARFEDVFQLVGISMVKCAMVAYNTSMVAYAQMADSMDMGGHLYTYNEDQRFGWFSDPIELSKVWCVEWLAAITCVQSIVI